jgi:hypothetical protein
MDEIDWVVAVRGASTGFTVLVISGVLVQVVARYGPVAGLVWLVVGALAAAAVSAWRVGPADSPLLTGAAAAFFSYSLSVPLIYLIERHIVWRDVAAFAGISVVAGGLTGLLRGRAHVPETKRPHGRRRGSRKP